METIHYYSTNRNISKDNVDFKTAVFSGLAPDQGLFMPEEIPNITKEELTSLQRKEYHEVASCILNKFLKGVIDKQTINKICKETYTWPIPITKIKEETYVLDLGKGPTASFKDFASQALATIMLALKPKHDITLLVATSGDTGSAVGEAFHNIPGCSVYILFPKNEVSELQRMQLERIGDNVTAIEVNGKFDECQAMVKEAFNDKELTSLNLTTANSINIGRVLPQICYYVYAYLQVAEFPEPITFAIPSGNFGNALGCEIARRMGIPIKKIVIAVNENDEFPRFLETKTYKKVDPSKKCISNAMNIGNPSNLARFFDLHNGTVDKEGTVHKQPNIEEMKNHIDSISISDAETKKSIKEAYEKYNVLLDPHGAVAFAAFEKKNIKEKTIIVETADPGKFPEIIKEVTGFSPEIPHSIESLKHRKKQVLKIGNEYEQLQKVLMNHENR